MATTVSLSIPESATGLNLTGVVHLYATAAPAPQKGVQFYVDGAKQGIPTLKAPYMVALDTSKLAKGTHIVKAVAMYKTRSYTASLVTSVGARSWPASFTTGPLGSGNILPTTTSGAFLASLFGGIGYSVTQQRTQIAARQTSMGRTYDVIQHHYDGSGTYGGVFGCEDPTDTAGASPSGISQEQYALNQSSYSAVVWTPNYTIDQINAGSADAIFTKMGTYWATYKPNPIMLRMFHEFDLYGFAWSVMSSPTVLHNTAAEFKSAWQRAIAKIQLGGGTNVGYWWCPFEGGYFGQNGFDSRTTLNTYYPGDAYVDWVGSDLYNSPNVPLGTSSPIRAGFVDWWELFNYSAPGSGYTGVWSNYDQFSSGLAVSGTRSWTGSNYQKPFMVGETSTMYDSTNHSAKGAWFQNVVGATNGGFAIDIGSMSECIGISFFDEDVHSASDWDWRVDSDASVINTTGSTSADPSCLSGFVTMSANSKIHGK